MKIPVPIDLLLVVIAIIICHFAKLEQLFKVQVGTESEVFVICLPK